MKELIFAGAIVVWFVLCMVSIFINESKYSGKPVYPLFVLILLTPLFGVAYYVFQI